jgi:hypothetical protein
MLSSPDARQYPGQGAVGCALFAANGRFSFVYFMFISVFDAVRFCPVLPTAAHY